MNTITKVRSAIQMVANDARDLERLTLLQRTEETMRAVKRARERVDEAVEEAMRRVAKLLDEERGAGR